MNSEHIERILRFEHEIKAVLLKRLRQKRYSRRDVYFFREAIYLTSKLVSDIYVEYADRYHNEGDAKDKLFPETLEEYKFDLEFDETIETKEAELFIDEAEVVIDEFIQDVPCGEDSDKHFFEAVKGDVLLYKKTMRGMLNDSGKKSIIEKYEA